MYSRSFASSRALSTSASDPLATSRKRRNSFEPFLALPSAMLRGTLLDARSSCSAKAFWSASGEAFGCPGAFDRQSLRMLPDFQRSKGGHGRHDSTGQRRCGINVARYGANYSLIPETHYAPLRLRALLYATQLVDFSCAPKVLHPRRSQSYSPSRQARRRRFDRAPPYLACSLCAVRALRGS